MKNNPAKSNIDRDERIYELYKKGAYTYRGLAKLFRVSHPTIIRVVKKREKAIQ